MSFAGANLRYGLYLSGDGFKFQPSSNIYVKRDFFQHIFQVLVKGGRWHIIPQLAVYTTYIPLIYCLLGGYMLPTTF